MIFGNIQGLISGVEQVLFDYTVEGSAVSSISTGNILNGNEDGWYTIIARNIYDTGTATMEASFNADTTTSNYGYRGIKAANTTVSNINSTSALIRMGSVASDSTSAFSVLRFYAKSGAVRLLNGVNVCNINGTTVTQIEAIGSVWNNTADNVAGMTFSANKLGVGTRIIILKSNNFTGGTPTGVITTPYIKGAWVRVGSQILGSATNIVTFSGLDGDTAVCYYLSSQIKAASATGDIKINLNNDTGNNYGYQRLTATNTTVAAARATPSCLYGGVTGTNAYFSQHNTLLFAKQGFIRPAITQTINDITGTTVTALWSLGQSYSVTNTKITEIDITTTTNNFDIGSQFDLYALYK
jgi:hypothetical protein